MAGCDARSAVLKLVFDLRCLTCFRNTSSTNVLPRATSLVLDIAEMAVNVGRSLDHGIPLTLKPSDERRRSTQFWRFDEDHRLKCRHKGLSVQVIYRDC